MGMGCVVLTGALALAAPILTRAMGGLQDSNATPLPQPAPHPRLDFIGEWGTRGAGPANLDLPTAIAADRVGRIYIADAGSGFLHKFTEDGHPLLAFVDPRLANPVAVAADADGGIYTADGRSGRVFVFSPTGDPDHEQHAAGLGRFRAPSALALDADNDLYVADAALGAVAEYTDRGRLLRLVGHGKKQSVHVRTPVALAVAPDGSWFVADQASGNVLHFSAQGDLVSTWDRSGSGGLRTKNPVSLAASDRYLFCFDAAPPRLLVWRLDGAPVFQQDLSTRIALSSGRPDTRAAITVVADGDLLLLDPSSGKVLRFRWVP
jgi:DNA-binding beta-propeller fold protein YncE